MWARLPSSSRLSGQREVGGCETEPCLFPSTPLWLCSVAVLQNNPNPPPPLGEDREAPQCTGASLANCLAVEYNCGGLLVFLLITSRLVFCSALWWVFTLTSQGSRRLAHSVSLMLPHFASGQFQITLTGKQWSKGTNACVDKQKAAGMGAYEMSCLFYGGGKEASGEAAEQELATKVMDRQNYFVCDLLKKYCFGYF